ncbi:MAG: hypothetical protein WAW80_01880 [Candidatus Saccharimonadales bacterium]
MTLDKNDINVMRDTIVDAIEQLVLPRFDENDKRFDALERDVADLKADVSELKTDVSGLKADVSELKTDVNILKDDMRDVKSTLSRLEGRIEALEADTKEIYYMLADLQKATGLDRKFAKLSLEQKLFQLNIELLSTAKEAGIVLPR